jgi:hypothetical protein
MPDDSSRRASYTLCRVRPDKRWTSDLAPDARLRVCLRTDWELVHIAGATVRAVVGNLSRLTATRVGPSLQLHMLMATPTPGFMDHMNEVIPGSVRHTGNASPGCAADEFLHWTPPPASYADPLPVPSSCRTPVCGFRSFPPPRHSRTSLYGNRCGGIVKTVVPTEIDPFPDVVHNTSIPIASSE